MKWIILLLILTSCTFTATTNVVKEFNNPPEAYFCPRQNCTSVLFQYFSRSNEIDCAMYDLNVPELVNILKIKNARMVMDDGGAVKTLNPVVDNKYSQMHDKFCVLDDETVITGSFNPTVGTGVKLNNNNVLVLHSKNIAKVFNEEFEELYSGTFSGGERTKNNIFYVNEDMIQIYFCPEDWCANKVLYELDDAKQSIYFMVFSFTHDQIGDILIKKRDEGIIVKGIMEKSQSSQYSEFSKLNSSGMDVKWDKNKGLLHHKVFIIDESIVITGSFNPSLNGDTNNDENLVIINNKEIAKKYVEEFNLLRN